MDIRYDYVTNLSHRIMRGTDPSNKNDLSSEETLFEILDFLQGRTAESILMKKRNLNYAFKKPQDLKCYAHEPIAVENGG